MIQLLFNFPWKADAKGFLGSREELLAEGGKEQVEGDSEFGNALRVTRNPQPGVFAKMVVRRWEMGDRYFGIRISEFGNALRVTRNPQRATARLGLAAALVLSLSAATGWGQILGLDGGFEGTATINNASTVTQAAAGSWTKNNSTTTIAAETSTVRSGGTSLLVNNSSTTGRRVWSPLITTNLTSQQVTIQFYRRVADTTNTQEEQRGVGDGTTSSEFTSGTYGKPTSTGTWEKVTFSRSAASYTVIAGVLFTRQTGTGGNMFIDDVAMYLGAVDTTAPNAPSSPTVTAGSGQLTVGWTAASGGVDNGGYMVVRGTIDPTTTPNVNGIYAVNNTVAAGQTVVYVGTNTSFTNTGLSNGTTYYYRIYTFDKAYNYSAAATTSGIPAIPVVAPTVTTPTAASVATTSATLGANVTDNGGAALSSRGTVWGTSANPTGNSLAEGGTTTGLFTHSRTGLIANTAYFYRGYAVNSAGTGYSADGTFTTLPLPPTVGSGSGASTSGFTANWSHPTMGSVSYTYTVEVDNDSNFGSIDATVSGISSSSTSQAISGLNAETTYFFRVRSVNATGSSVNSSTSAGITTLAASTPTLTGVTLGSAMTATYPAVSAGVSFTASGTNLSANITVSAQSGYEVSTDNSSFSSSVSVAGGATVWVRTVASRAADTFNNTTVAVLSGGGASSSVNVTSSASNNSVAQKSLTISGASAANRAYDGTTTVAVSGGSLVGVVTGDVANVTLGGSPTGSVTTAAVGDSKAVTVTGYSISGTASGNYSLTQPTGLSVNITQKTLTITGLTFQNKVYDRTTSASATGTAALSGVISGDSANVTLGGTPVYSFASSGVGTAISITTTGYTISGTASGNYSLTQPSGSANITQKALTITGASATNRAYDGTTTVAVSGGSLSGVVSGDSVTMGGSPTGTVATATVANGKTVTVTGYSISGTDSGNYSITQPTTLTVNITSATPPTLTVATGANVDGAFDVTFADDALWRSQISSITVAGTTLTAGYTVSAGKITFTPSTSNPTNLLRTSGTKAIVVNASNYAATTSISQTINPGAATQLAVTTQPAAPSSNGGALATQPVVTIRDQYNNTVTTSSATVAAAVGSGTWTLGGTTTNNASSGVATFSGLTATSAAAVTGATITFSSAGLTGATSSTFNIPVPVPANDLSSSPTTITVNGGAVSGTTLGATRSSPWTSGGSDVWYQFTAPATGTVTITTTTTSSSRQDLDLLAWSNSAPAATSGSIMSGGSSSSDTTTESGTISATNGIVYFIRVLRFNDGGTAGAFTITATMPVAPSTQATSFTSSSITSSSATVGWARGNGTGGVLVVARAGGAVNADPTDGTNYTASATFGSGTQIGTGNFVVYKGTGTSVNVAGLSAGTTYHFEVYEYNTDGLMHNMAGLVGNLTTSAGIPTVTSSAATSVGSTVATLNGNPTADGGDAITGRGFVYSTTDTTPTIGEAGVTQVSLSGTTGAMSTALSSLGANTTYYFNAYAINSIGTSYGTVQSFTTSQLSAPTTLAASATTSAGFTANWNAVDGATGYQLDVYTGSSSTTTLYSANFNNFTGSGFTSAPATGQLDSDDWKITGMSDGNSTFSGSFTTGDFAVGASTGGVTTGGIYAFTVGAGNVALGVQPTANDWAPGTIVLRIQNTTGSTLTSLDVSYKIWVLNDQGRSSSFNFSHSANDSTYTSVVALDYTSTAIADGAPVWVSVNRSTTITGLTIANNAYYYLRWSGADVGGSGSRDEFALDDVQVSSTTSNISYLSGYQNLSVGNVTTYAVTGAGTATGYSYVVRATSPNSTSANSDVRAVTTKGITLISVNSGTTSLTYSGLAQGPTFTVTGSAGALSYSYAGTGATNYGPTATAPTNVGTYTVTATVAADANFDGASSSATAFTIEAASQAAVSGSLGSATITFGSTTTVTASGGSGTGAYEFRQNGGTGSVGFTGTGASRTISTTTAGTALIQVRRVADSNYSDSAWVTAGTLTIAKATPTITAAPTASAITYGQTLANSTLSGGTGSVAGGFAFTSSSTAPNAGTANQNVTFTPTDTTNYNTATTTVSVTVNPASLAITAVAKSKVYGAADPALTYTSSGLVGSDNISGGLARAAGENAGIYAINQGTLSAGSNYSISYTGANLTITAAALPAVTWGTGTITNSNGVSGFSYLYMGRSSNGISTSYSNNVAPSAAGYYTSVATSTDGNYTGSTTNNYYVAGPVAVNDAVVRPSGNTTFLIPTATLLQNDRRIQSDGSVLADSLSVTGVAAGTGSPTVATQSPFVSFTAGGTGVETFTYTLRDAVTSLTTTGTVTVTPQASQSPFELSGIIGTPVYDGVSTTVRLTFTGTANTTYYIFYKGELRDPVWKSAGGWYSENGTFSVDIQETGDQVSDWSGSMFFRANQ